MPESTVLPLIIAAALGYLLGSFPTAYLLVQWKSRVDIRSAGSGNVGTLNSYVVSGSRLVGVSVLLVDLLKGALAVVLASLVLNDELMVKGVAGVAAVVGHNYSLWLGFRGGRGLATAAGVFLCISWLWVVLWLVAWGGAYLALREINPANAVASLVFLLSLWVLPQPFIALSIPPAENVLVFQMMASLVILIILLRHVQPLREFVKARTITRRDRS